MPFLSTQRLADDPRYADNATRVKNRKVVVPRLEEIFRTRTTADWLARLREADVPAAPVNNIDAAFAEPPVAEREMIVEYEHPQVGKVRLPGNPIKMSDMGKTISRPAPMLDEHTDAVLRDAVEFAGRRDRGAAQERRGRSQQSPNDVNSDEGSRAMRGLYWEEWDIGAEFESPARTVTEADMVIYAGLSGDYNPLHVNEEYCKTTPFGTRIVHGPLVYAIAAGLIFQLHLYDDTLIAFLGFDSLKFTKPVKPGDTIHAVIKVLEKRETSNPERGVMKRELKVLNQRGEVVQDALQAFLLKRKPAA